MSAVVFERLGRRGAPLADILLERVGQACALAAESAADEGDDEEEGARPVPEFAAPAAAAMGAAMRHLGPDEVLRVLPLNLIEVNGLCMTCQKLIGWAHPCNRALCKGHHPG